MGAVFRRKIRNLLQLRGPLADNPTAESGVQAIESFQTWRPHFIRMDRRMPGMDGIETARRIRSMEGGNVVKIACVSASVLAEDEIAAAGFDDFVRKPCTARTIFDCAARHPGVRYVSEKLPAVPEAIHQALCPEALASIPAELRGELDTALISLDLARINAVICRISEVEPEIGRTLTRHAEQFAFTVLLRTLQQAAPALLTANA